MEIIALFGVAALVSAIGFRRFVWFISLGYGFSVAAIGLVLTVMSLNARALVPLAMSMLLIVYGCRLGGYLLVRERRSAAYRETIRNEIKDSSGTPLPVKVVVWLSCALLYACETSPILFRVINRAPVDAAAVAGIVVMTTGIVLESVADHTKNRYKQSHPHRFCDVGVFRLVRCPNYLGEVLTWTGVFISGLTAVQGVWQWIATTAGWLCIVWIMFGGARRLEIRQNKNYGDDPEYRAYASRTPILIPFIPLYSVAKHHWLVG